MSGGFVWYDKTATDHRVWCVLSGDKTVRAARVKFIGDTSFKEDGHQYLQPGGPRGVIVAEELETFDEVPCG